MLIRIFRVTIYPELREEFEQKFATTSISAVQTQKGFLSVSIGKPTKWAPDDYVMISHWETEASLEEFIGPSWNEAHIPEGMEKFVRECSVCHYHEYGHA